jgi:hypothetical protein
MAEELLFHSVACVVDESCIDESSVTNLAQDNTPYLHIMRLPA